MDDTATIKFVQCDGCDTPNVCVQRGCGSLLREYAQAGRVVHALMSIACVITASQRMQGCIGND